MVDQHEAPSFFQQIDAMNPDFVDHFWSTVLQRCADHNHRSVFSAARAHSSLHKAVTARSSITAHIETQKQMDEMLQYVDKYSRHVDSLSVSVVGRGPYGFNGQQISIRQLPSGLRLCSLELKDVDVQLQGGLGGGSFQGILGAAAGVAALKKLRLFECELLDDRSFKEMEAALALLPVGLEHLSIHSKERMVELSDDPDTMISVGCNFPTAALQHLQQLTYLELDGVQVYDDADFDGLEMDGPPQQDPLQPLQSLSSLLELRLSNLGSIRITASALSQAQHLTRLQLLAYEDYDVEPVVLAGKTKLQHLEMLSCIVVAGAAGEAQLSKLQHMQQLTHLDLSGSLTALQADSPPAAAYAALTASSKLHSLKLHSCSLPVGVWQHMFPAGRQLPHLQELNISGPYQQLGSSTPSTTPEGTTGLEIPEGSSLVSCCPNLQSLRMLGLQYSIEQLAPLQQLSMLRALQHGNDTSFEGLEVVCQLTGLQDLWLVVPAAAEGLLLQLTSLQQLTRFKWQSATPGVWTQAPDGEPVWRQLLRHHLNNPNPAVAQQAAAALADLSLE